MQGTPQEAIRVLLQQDSHAFLALYDLEKTFDSVEVPVLFYCLFNAGINVLMAKAGDCWYVKLQCCGHHSGYVFLLQRGVRQGSVLSPILFITLMDDLLRSLEADRVGTSIDGSAVLAMLMIYVLWPVVRK